MGYVMSIELSETYREWKQIEKLPDSAQIIGFLADLDFQQRAILSMRCFNEMSFEEIAEVMDFGLRAVRRIFEVSKMRVLNKLKKNGINNDKLVPIIAFFGMLTDEEAGIMDIFRMKELVGSVRAGGFWGRLFGCLRLVRVFGVHVLLAGSVIAAAASEAGASQGLCREAVTSVHYVRQGVTQNNGRLESMGAYEKWLYFPEGPDGPIFYRMQRWNIAMTGKMCSWLQNGDGVYYYHSGRKTMYLNNAPVSHGPLPTDGKAAMDLYRQLTGDSAAGLEFQWNQDGRLLMEISDSRIASVGMFIKPVLYNDTKIDFFERDNWVKDAEIVDRRDVMHRRGWTYIEITGHLGGNRITGKGCVPLTYNQYKQRPPWLIVQIDGVVRITDCADGAVALRPNGDKRYYPSGRFFKGLTRPWMGYSATEAAVRDCVSAGAVIEKMDSRLVVRPEGNDSDTTLSYAFDSNGNTVRMLIIEGKKGTARMMLKFHQDIDAIKEGFVEPDADVPAEIQKETPAGLWFLDYLDAETARDYGTAWEEDVRKAEENTTRKTTNKCAPPLI